MKKKISILLIIFMLIFTNYAFAYTRVTDSTATKLNSVVDNVITDKTMLSGIYDAITSVRSQEYDNDKYSDNVTNNYSETEYSIKVNAKYHFHDTVYYTDNKQFYLTELPDGNNGTDYYNRYITIKFKDIQNDIEFADNEFNITYPHCITYNGNKYNMTMKLKSIHKHINADQEIYFQVGKYTQKDKTPVNFLPGVGASSSSGHTEVDVDYVFTDDDGNAVNMAGVFKLADIDLQQGIGVENYLNASSSSYAKMYMPEETKGSGKATDTICYYATDPAGSGATSTGIYIYSTTDQNLKGGISNVYFATTTLNHLKLQFTFDEKRAFSNVGFCNDIETYNKVETSVENGTITASDYRISSGENKTIEYAPQDNTYYLEEITVDGSSKSTTTYPNAYTFSNINADHTISVKYAKKYEVSFNSKGGKDIDSDYVIPQEKATEPAEPTRQGYEFKGWYIDEAYTTPYDFTTPVNEDITLYAKWEEIPQDEITHRITYRIIGTPSDNNATNNPTEYTEGSTTAVSINNPTLDGYTFSGWYENSDLSGSAISTLDVSSRTDDITLYGKWIKNEEPENPDVKTTATYKVNHYLEDTNGTVEKNGKKYKLDTTDSKTGTIDSTITENSKIYAGYKAEQNSLSGTVESDGSLTLDFYYNKVEYTITFDSQGGTEVENQTKNYNEKVDKPDNPTKDGYTFWYWYEEVDGEKKIYDFDTPVTEDKTLIAEWKENKVVPSEDTPKTEEKTEIPAGKTDTTTATKILPNTGIVGTTIITLVVLIGAFFGIRYLKLKKDMK